MAPKGDLFRIEAPHFVAGIVVGERAAPIVSYMVGWSEQQLRTYCVKRGWKGEQIVAFQQRKQWSGKSKGTSLRLTGFFKSRNKPGLAVGSIEDLGPLIDKIKAARAAGKGLVCFLWRNNEEGKPPFVLSVDVAGDAPKRRAADPFDDGDGEDAEDEEEVAIAATKTTAAKRSSLFDD